MDLYVIIGLSLLVFLVFYLIYDTINQSIKELKKELQNISNKHHDLANKHEKLKYDFGSLPSFTEMPTLFNQYRIDVSHLKKDIEKINRDLLKIRIRSHRNLNLVITETKNVVRKTRKNNRN